MTQWDCLCQWTRFNVAYALRIYAIQVSAKTYTKLRIRNRMLYSHQ